MIYYGCLHVADLSFMLSAHQNQLSKTCMHIETRLVPSLRVFAVKCMDVEFSPYSVTYINAHDVP